MGRWHVTLGAVYRGLGKGAGARFAAEWGTSFGIESKASETAVVSLSGCTIRDWNGLPRDRFGQS